MIEKRIEVGKYYTIKPVDYANYDPYDFVMQNGRAMHAAGISKRLLLMPYEEPYNETYPYKGGTKTVELVKCYVVEVLGERPASVKDGKRKELWRMDWAVDWLEPAKVMSIGDHWSCVDVPAGKITIPDIAPEKILNKLNELKKAKVTSW